MLVAILFSLHSIHVRKFKSWATPLWVNELPDVTFATSLGSETKEFSFKFPKTEADSRFTTACHTSLPSSSFPKMPASTSPFVEILESGEKAFSLIAAIRCENFSPNSSESFFSFNIGFLSLLALPRIWSAIESISELVTLDPEIRDFLSKFSIVLLPIN